MKVLMLSADESILKGGSDANQRMKDYGGIFDELHIVVYTATGYNGKKISENIWIYPTNTAFKPLYFFAAYRIGKNIIHNSSFLIHNSIITSQDAVTGVVALFLRRVFKIPVQVQVHTDFLSPYFRKESFKNFLKYLVYKYCVKRADCVRAVSGRIKRSIIDNLNISKEKVIVLPIFVDIEGVRKSKPEFGLHEKYPGYKKIILMVSRITREKNIDIAIRAAVNISADVPGILLLVVGNGPLKRVISEKYKKYFINPHIFSRAIEPRENDLETSSIYDVKPHGIREGVGINNKSAEPESGKFLCMEDAVSFPTLVSYYKTADVFLLTSDYEGYGRTIIEAVASGMAVISTDVGIAKEILETSGAGRVVPVRDENALAGEMRSILSDDGLLKEMRERAFKMEKITPFADKKDYLRQFKESFTVCVEGGE